MEKRVTYIIPTLTDSLPQKNLTHAGDENFEFVEARRDSVVSHYPFELWLVVFRQRMLWEYEVKVKSFGGCLLHYHCHRGGGRRCLDAPEKQMQGCLTENDEKEEPRKPGEHG